MATPAQDRQPAQDPSDRLDARLVKAISHPLRHRLLVRLNERVASPNELARELGEPLGRVSYHVRTLADIGAIELVRTEPRRGAVEHYYRAAVRAWFGDEDWAKLPISTRRELFGQHLQRIVGDIAAAAGAGGFDHAKAWVSFVTLALDEEGMAEISDLLDETLRKALQVQAASKERGGELTTELVLLHFEPRGGD
jgi:DNA-binding transcriptional ArsR family regulator